MIARRAPVFEKHHIFDTLMKRTVATSVCTLLVGLSFGTMGFAQSDLATPDLDPAALEVLESAASFLERQESFEFKWFVSYDEIVDGREKLTFTRSGRNLGQRGVGFYSYSISGEDTREYFFDGSMLAINDIEENAYVAVPFSGSLDDLTIRLEVEYDVQLPIWQLMSNNPGTELLSAAESAAYVGLTTIAGRPAHHLAFSSYESDWQVWISSEPDQPEVLMIVGTDPYQQGWPQYRAYFTEWNFSPEIADGAFTFTPDAEAERMTWPKTSGEVSELRGRPDYSNESAPIAGSE